MKSVFSLSILIMSINSVDAGGVWTSFQNGGATAADSATASPGKVKWSTRLSGYGQSSPVVWKDTVYVTTVEGDNKDNCHVTAYQLANGEQIWQQTLANASPRKSSTYVSRAAPTPVADVNGIVCFFEGGNIVALSHGGELRWERNLVTDYGGVESRHGLSSSLEQDADSVFVWVERSEDPYVLSLNKQSGETNWKVKGLGATSWSSPRLVPVADGDHLVLSAVGSIAGLDPATGRQLWLFDQIAGNSTPTPMPLGDGRFLIGATVGRGGANKKSKGPGAAESNGVLRIVRAADGTWSADYVWRAKRATSSFGSPIVHEGIAFFVNRQGVLFGLNVTDGKQIFTKRLKGSSWATPIGVGNHIIFFERDGIIETLSSADSVQDITTWKGLPSPHKTDTSEVEAKTGGKSSVTPGPVLYAGVWCEDCVLLRRGSELFSVTIETATD